VSLSIQITLNRQERELLDAMVNVGIYGCSVEEIVKRAIDERLIEVFTHTQSKAERRKGGA
jgi:hypothetical protein